MASDHSKREDFENGAAVNASVSSSISRPTPPKLKSRQRANAGTVSQNASLRKLPAPTSEFEVALAPFSPTHISPTEQVPRLQGQFECRPRPSSSSPQSSHAAFTDSSPSGSHPSSQHVILSRSSSRNQINSINVHSISEGRNEVDIRLSSSRNRSEPVSARTDLPLIQTSFESGKPRASQNRSLIKTPASSSVPSRAVRGPFTTPKTSTSFYHDSPATSTTLTTPSSIGFHQNFYFSPARTYIDALARSPATSFADSTDLQHSNLISKSQDDDFLEGQADDNIFSHEREYQREPMSAVRSSSLLDYRDDIASITPAMLLTRLMHCNLISNEGLASLYSLSSSLPSSSSDDRNLLSPGFLAEGTLSVQQPLRREFIDALNFRSTKKEGLLLSEGEELSRQVGTLSREGAELGLGTVHSLKPRKDPQVHHHSGKVLPGQENLSLSPLLSASSFSNKERWQDGSRRGSSTKSLRVHSSGNSPANKSAAGSDSTASTILTAKSFSTAQGKEVGEADTASFFQQESAKRILLLYVTSDRTVLSPETVSTLQLSGAIHIDIPSSIVRHPWRKRRASADAFANLEPYLVDEMSKRQFDELSLEESRDGLLLEYESQPYWHRQIVLCGHSVEVTEASQDSNLESPISITDNSATVRLLAEAVKELGSRYGKGKGVFVLEGGISGLREAMHRGDDVRDVKDKAVGSAPLANTQASGRSSKSISPTSPEYKGPTLFKDSHVFKSPGRMEASSGSTLEVPNPISLDQTSPATVPTTPNKPRSARPMLARLNTSEAVKRTTGDSVAADASRKLSLSASRLTVNTSFGNSRSATLSEGVLPMQDPTYSKMLLQDESRSRTFDFSTIPVTIPQTPAFSTGATSTSTFAPSEILSGFLYLGPEISTSSELKYLEEKWGIKRILNAAHEIEDNLSLNNARLSGIDKYKKIPMKDIVEARGVQEDIEEACAFIDDAKLHSAPVYIHCKAGKSRSVLLVMAYLIHANRWTLPRAYSYVVDRRHTVSPNIGFVAELMTFEQRRLDPKRSKPTSARPIIDRKGELLHGINTVNKWSNRESLPTNTSIHPITLSFWDHFSDTQEKDRQESLNGKRLYKVLAGKGDQGEEDDDTLLPMGVTSLKEYKGLDGRYHARRPPADEKLQAPNWRATMAAIDSEHIFSFRDANTASKE